MVRNMLSTRTLLVAFLLVATPLVAQLVAQTSADAVQDAGRQNLGAFLRRIPAGMESKYGFHGRSGFSRARAGRPIRVYIILPDSLRSELSLQKEYLIPTEEWRVPVEVDGETEALLTVSHAGGKPKAVSLGGAALAREIAALDLNRGQDDLAILRVYQLECDFLIIIPHGKRARDGEFHVLNSAAKVFAQELDPSTSYPGEKVLKTIREKYLDKLWSK